VAGPAAKLKTRSCDWVWRGVWWVVCDWVEHLIEMGLKENEKKLVFVLVGLLKMVFWRRWV
jgi:hypothetical protein